PAANGATAEPVVTQQECTWSVPRRSIYRVSPTAATVVPITNPYTFLPTDDVFEIAATNTKSSRGFLGGTEDSGFDSNSKELFRSCGCRLCSVALLGLLGSVGMVAGCYGFCRLLVLYCCVCIMFLLPGSGVQMQAGTYCWNADGVFGRFSAVYSCSIAGLVA
ncbi:hypothetical protein SOVF_203480, partial [Spinacia oleracea]